MYKRLLTLVTLLLFTSLLQAQTTIRITNGDWDPYMSSHAYQYGLTSHMVTQAFKLEGIDIEWGFFPWKRAFESAKEGRDWDAAAAWWPSDAYQDDFYTSDAIMDTALVFFHLKEYEFHWNGVDDLKGISIGFTRGYSYGEALMDAKIGNRINTEVANTDEQNFNKLLFERIQIFPNDKTVGYTQIKNTFTPHEANLFTHHPKEFKVNTLHLLVSKRSKNAKLFLDKFNSGLKKLRASPQYQQMFNDLKQGKYQRQSTPWRQ